jgi:hypothetical protein
VAGLILDGTIRARGVQPPERCVPPAPLLAALRARGMAVRVKVTRGRRRVAGP